MNNKNNMLFLHPRPVFFEDKKDKKYKLDIRRDNS